MNKETKKIVILLGKERFLDEVFKFSDESINSQDVETSFKNPEYLYHTRNMADYWLIGVAEGKLIASSYDNLIDYDFYDKEEFYLIPFIFFAHEYSDSESLERITYFNFELKIKKSLNRNAVGIYEYTQDMLKYIEWYKEQDYPMYEYIQKLEVFLKEQIELWKDKFEKIKNYE